MLAALALPWLLPHLGRADQRFPIRTVRLIVPFPAGQAADTGARLLAHHLTRLWDQQVIVENRAGGLGIPAMLAVKQAAPDGYTLMFGTTGSLCVNPALRANIPYNVEKDFAPVSNALVTPLLLIVHPSLPARTVSELVGLAQGSTRPLQFGSAGVGTSQHLTGEIFAVRAGIKLEHVAYRGSTPAITDLMGGQIKLMVDSLTSALPHIRSGKVRAIAVTTTTRVSQLPDVPTVAESGYPGFDAVGWASIVAPARTPAPLIEKISAGVRQALSNPQLRAEFASRGLLATPSTPSELEAFLRSETIKWTKLARDAQILLDE